MLGDALPLIVALVIAGIDVVETSFLLLVVATGRSIARRRRRLTSSGGASGHHQDAARPGTTFSRRETAA